MSQNFSANIDTYDSPPSYDEVCSSRNLDRTAAACCASVPPDKKWTEAEQKVTALSFHHENACDLVDDSEINSSKAIAPVAINHEIAGSEAYECDGRESRNDVVIPICRNCDSREVPEYSRVTNYDAVELPRIHEHKQMDALESSTERLRSQILKGLVGLTIILIILSLVTSGILKENFNSRSNEYGYPNEYGHYWTTTESAIDRLFRVNDYLSGRRNFDELRNENEQNDA